jgi:hypothetical protein
MTEFSVLFDKFLGKTQAVTADVRRWWRHVLERHASLISRRIMNLSIRSALSGFHADALDIHNGPVNSDEGIPTAMRRGKFSVVICLSSIRRLALLFGLAILRAYQPAVKILTTSPRWTSLSQNGNTLRFRTLVG